MARKYNPKRFPQIPAPWTRLVVQVNGDLALVRDLRNMWWLVNTRHKRVHPERFETLESAKREASSISFISNPAAPSPEWEEVEL